MVAIIKENTKIQTLNYSKTETTITMLFKETIQKKLFQLFKLCKRKICNYLVNSKSYQSIRNNTILHIKPLLSD